MRAGRASNPLQGFIVLSEVTAIWGKAERDYTYRGWNRRRMKVRLEVTPLGDVLFSRKTGRCNKVVVTVEKDPDVRSQLCWGKTNRGDILEKVASSF